MALDRTSVTHRVLSSWRTELDSVEICSTESHPFVCRWLQCKRRVECAETEETSTCELGVVSELDASFVVATENVLWSLDEVEASNWLDSYVRGDSSGKIERNEFQIMRRKRI